MSHPWIKEFLHPAVLLLGAFPAGDGPNGGRRAVAADREAIARGDQGDKKGLTINKDLKIEGMLTAQDPKIKIVHDSPFKRYDLRLLANKTYTFDMISDDFDAFLILQDADERQLAKNDDAYGETKTLNSRIVFPSFSDGVYRILASCLDAKTGSFTLKVREEPSAMKLIDKLFEVGGGLVVEGVLSKEVKGISYDIKLIGGKNYRIELKSGQLDSYLYLLDARGKELARDDDSGGHLNSRISYRPATSGTYRLVATSLEMRGTGGFSLQVRQE